MVKQNEIVRLSLVAKYGRSPIFIGWDDSDRSLASSNLSEEARNDFNGARESGASFPSVPSSSILCYDFSSLGKGIDYPGKKEDVISVIVRDENKSSVTLNFGEGTLLKAMEWSLSEDNIWSSLAGTNFVNDGSEITSTTAMYTLLFQDNRVQGGSVCALLFKPLMSTTSNEGTFLRFVKGVIKQLLVIDESQPPGARKGYIRVAAKASKGGYKTGLVDLLFDTADEQTAKALGNAKASGLKLLQTLGIAEVSDELIKEVQDPLPTYNVDSLDLIGLRELVSAMKELAPYRNRS
jgi:hypothetical protein